MTYRPGANLRCPWGIVSGAGKARRRLMLSAHASTPGAGMILFQPAKGRAAVSARGVQFPSSLFLSTRFDALRLVGPGNVTDVGARHSPQRFKQRFYQSAAIE